MSWRWTLIAMVTWNAVVEGHVSPLTTPRCSQGAGAHHKPLPCQQRILARYQVQRGNDGDDDDDDDDDDEGVTIFSYM